MTYTLLAQAPFNPKDWFLVLPVSIIAIAFLVWIGVWAARQLGLTKKDGNGYTNGTKAKLEYHDKEIERLRNWRHDAEPQLKLLMDDHLRRLRRERGA